jgi:AcrR family transcriptional regulator
MSDDPSDPADLQRRIELLWGRDPPARRGPKPKASLDEVLEAAIAIADREGLSALAMRRVSEALGLSPMALYTYAPSKAALVDLMLERAWGEVGPPDPTLNGWRAKLEFMARQQWALAQRHPWMLEAPLHRPALGPNFMARIEQGFAALDELGLEPAEMELLFRLVTDYVRGAVRSAVEARQVEQRTGMSDEEWIAAARPALKEVIEPKAYPVLVRTGAERQAAGRKAGRELGFEFGLQRVLDGVAAFVEQRHGKDA